MPRIPLRLLVPLAAVVLLWGSVHLLGSHDLTVTPAAWPAAAASASPAPSAVLVSPAAQSPSPSGAGGIPVLPGALRQLNGSTRDTAVGLYALIQQLETALGDHLRQLTQQLEPGR